MHKLAATYPPSGTWLYRFRLILRLLALEVRVVQPNKIGFGGIDIRDFLRGFTTGVEITRGLGFLQVQERQLALIVQPLDAGFC